MVIPFRTIGNELLRPSSDMVLYAPLWNQKLIGTTFYSMDSNRHLMTNVGATWGKYGRTFDGTDDNITIPDHAALKPTTAISVFVWLNIVSFGASSSGVISKTPLGSSYGDWDIFQDNASSRVYFTIGGSANQFNITNVVALNTWVLVGMTYNKAIIQAYRNGVADNSKAYSTNIATNAVPIKIGVFYQDTAARYSNNKIGEVWIYNRTLSAGEVMRLYQNTKWRYN